MCTFGRWRCLQTQIKNNDNHKAVIKKLVDRFIRKIYLFNDKVLIHLFPTPNQTIFQMTETKELKDMETKIVYISEEYSLYYQGGSLVLELYRK